MENTSQTKSWKRVSIKDMCSSIIDCINKTAKTVENKTPYKMLRTTNVKNGWVDTDNVRYVTEETYQKWTRRQVPMKGDIILTREAPLGEVGMLRSDDKVFLGQRLVSYRTNPEKLDNKFLLYSFLSADLIGQIKSLGSGSTVEHMRVPDAEKLTILAPEIHEQRKISSVIAAYYDLIENNENRIKTLEEMAQMLYTEWFVKFKFPGHEKAKMVESGTEYGMIPEGWEVKSLDNIAFQKREAVNPSDIDTETPYIGLEHIPRKTIILSEWGRAGQVRSGKLVFKKGDVLFGKIRPYFHKVVVAPIDGVSSSDAIIISSKEEKYRSIILLLISSETFVSHATKTSQGTKMPRAEWAVLKKWLVPLPVENRLMFQFNLILASWIEEMNALMGANRILRSNRDLLIPQLVTGKRTIKA